jgi:hypothetical protein
MGPIMHSEQAPVTKPMVICLNMRALFDGNHNHRLIAPFLAEFHRVLYNNQVGGLPSPALRLVGGWDLPLRAMVGQPEGGLLHGEMSAVEAACSLILDRPIHATSNLWVRNRSGWMPSNPASSAGDLAGKWLDTDWMTGLGVPKPVWQKFVLGSDVWERPKWQNSKEPPARPSRMFISLAAYGFSDPWQFFTDDKQAA